MPEPQTPELKRLSEMSYGRELERLAELLGERPAELPGELRSGERPGGLSFAAGEVSEELLLERIADPIKDREIDSYWELTDYRRTEGILRALRVWKRMQEAATDAEREKLLHEFIIANQETTYHEYLPQVIEQIGQTIAQYEQLRERARLFGITVPLEFDKGEELARQYLVLLNDAMAKRIAFGNALTIEAQIDLKEQLPEIERRLQSEPQTEAQRDIHDRLNYYKKLAEHWNLANIPQEQLAQERQAALSRLSQEERELLERREGILTIEEREQIEEGIRVHKNNLNQNILDILTGKKEKTGLEHDFIPQQLYIVLWQHFDGALRDIDADLQREMAQQPESEVDELQKLIDYVRAQRDFLTEDNALFTHDLITYQMTLENLTRVQNQFGRLFSTEGVVGMNPQLAPEESKAIQGWLDARVEFRKQQVLNVLEAVESMLDVTLPERFEDWTTEKGYQAFSELVEGIAGASTFWIPSEKREDAGPAEEAYNLAYQAVARMLDLPKSREERIRELAGPIKKQLGWPENKLDASWEELTDEEKKGILARCQSVVQLKEQFDRKSVERLRTSMALIEQLPNAKTYAGEMPDMGLIEQIEQDVAVKGERIDRNLAGEVFNGKTINQATATLLMLRQREREWGDPTSGMGVAGEYAKYMQGLEDNLELHLDVSGALYRMQEAWEEHAWDSTKFFVGGAGALLAAGSLAGVVGGGLYLGYRGTRCLFNRSTRLARWSRERLPGAGRVLGQTREKLRWLTRMRYLRWERQLVQAMQREPHLARVFSRMKSLQNLRVVRGSRPVLRIAGKTLEYAAIALIPTVAYLENKAIQKRIEDAEGDVDFQGVLRDEKWTTRLEATGILAAVLGVTGTVGSCGLAGTVWWAGEYKRRRQRALEGWARDVETWMKEYDPAGLRQELETRDEGNVVGTAGGGAYRTTGGYLLRKISPWHDARADVEEAAQQVEHANVGERAAMYEAYLWQTLRVPEGTTGEEAQRIVQDKLTYLNGLTHGRWFDVTNDDLARADVYAQLQQRRRAMEKNGVPPVISYYELGKVDREEDLVRQWLDLDRLNSGDQQARSEIVGRYMEYVQPLEEIFQFNAMGEEAREEKRTVLWSSTEQYKNVRQYLLQKFMHHIIDAEKRVRSVNWPGFDTKKENLVRSYFAHRFEAMLDQAVIALLEGASLDEYNALMQKLEVAYEELRDATEDPEKYYEQAENFFKGKAMQGERPRKNYADACKPKNHPIYEMLGYETEEKE